MRWLFLVQAIWHSLGYSAFPSVINSH
ncbi:MAG: hypothetical protein KKC84_03100 [Candidatus Omnitrophica bacterium]|nr:hypothetical protein [Candidatus Omnitrophota bacterium]